MVTVIISRYNENIEWIKRLTNQKIIIFNKGNNNYQSCNTYNLIELPNVGREGHTFYHYIYENYDNLDDYTAFLQGNPFDHCHDVIERIQKYDTSNNISEFELLSNNETLVTLENDILFDDDNIENKIPLLLVYNHVFGVYQIENIQHLFGVGGQFIVSKKRILSNPKELYGRIVKLLSRTKSPIEGYVIERFPSLLFNR
jgi:hypothetical protein